MGPPHQTLYAKLTVLLINNIYKGSYKCLAIAFMFISGIERGSFILSALLLIYNTLLKHKTELRVLSSSFRPDFLRLTVQSENIIMWPWNCGEQPDIPKE